MKGQQKIPTDDMALVIEVPIQPRKKWLFRLGFMIMRFGSWCARVDAQLVPGALFSGELICDRKEEIWEAINWYAASCGGDITGNTATVQRQEAVVEVETRLGWNDLP